ncbi:MAG: methyltransferase domain-containing protein [bacterium]|nr:methyltransferase domain-containing protein [bacterium]
MKCVNRGKIVTFVLTLFLLSAGLALMGAGAGEKDHFQGIDNPKVLPMLKHLPYTYGGMNVPPADGRLLYDLIIDKNYKRGLELGTSNGYSTLWLGLAFRKTGGRVITVEIEPKRANEARRNFAKAGLTDVIDSRINNAFKEIPKLKGEFDFIFIDAWKPDYIGYLELLKDKVKPGGVITAHNVLSHGRSMQDFLKAIKADPSMETKIHRSSRSGVSVSFIKK